MQKAGKEKTFEAGLYTPKGFTRKITPVTNTDLQHLSVQVMNKTSSKALTKGNTEVHSGMVQLNRTDDCLGSHVIRETIIFSEPNKRRDSLCLCERRLSLH